MKKRAKCGRWTKVNRTIVPMIQAIQLEQTPDIWHAFLVLRSVSGNELYKGPHIMPENAKRPSKIPCLFRVEMKNKHMKKAVR